MEEKGFLRTACLFLILIVLGHSTTFLFPKSQGPEEDALFAAMKNYTFDVMGSTRSHFEFYQSYSMILSLHLLVITLIIWNLSCLKQEQLAQMKTGLTALSIGSVVFSYLCWTDFFVVPATCATVAALCLTLATVQTYRMKIIS